MTQSLAIPPELMQALQLCFESLYPGVEDIGLVLIAVKTDWAPEVCSTIPPSQVDDLFQFLIDHRQSALDEVHTVDSEGRIQTSRIN